MSHSAALLDWYSLDLIHQHVWGMENGNQTLKKLTVKVVNCITILRLHGNLKHTVPKFIQLVVHCPPGTPVLI